MSIYSFDNSYEGYLTRGESSLTHDWFAVPRTGGRPNKEPRFPFEASVRHRNGAQVAMDDPTAARPESGRPASGAVTGSASRETGVVLASEREADAARDRIVRFVRETVPSADAEGVVVNMCGGVDSTVTAALAVDALGPEHVYGVILPCNKLGEPSARNAEALAGALDIEHDTLHLRPLFTQFGAVVGDRFEAHEDPISADALLARLRTTVTYLAADDRDALVCGTTNRSDRLLGRVVEYGGRDADLSPISHLFRTDVRVLAELLDVPEFVTDRPRSVERLPEPADGAELADGDLDRVLRLHVDEGLDAEEVAAETGIDPEVVSSLCARYARVERERRLPRRLAPDGGSR